MRDRYWLIFKKERLKSIRFSPLYIISICKRSRYILHLVSRKKGKKGRKIKFYQKHTRLASLSRCIPRSYKGMGRCKRRFVSEHFTPRRHSWTLGLHRHLLSAEPRSLSLTLQHTYRIYTFSFSSSSSTSSYPTPLEFPSSDFAVPLSMCWYMRL